MRDYEELGSYREVIYFFKRKDVKFACVIFQVQDNGAYPLGLDKTPNAIDLFIVPFF